MASARTRQRGVAGRRLQRADLAVSLLASAIGLGVAAWVWFDRTILSDLPGNLAELRDVRPQTAVESILRNG